MQGRSCCSAVIIIGAILSTGCTNPEIIPISQNTYMLAKADNAGIFGNASKMKAEVIQQANAFAESKGKVAVPIFLREVPIGFGRKATVEYQFKLVDKNSPEAINASLIPRADVVIEKTEKSSHEIQTTDKTLPKKDVYSELLKLDDLRKKGIITEEEFQAQKAKLLKEQ